MFAQMFSEDQHRLRRDWFSNLETPDKWKEGEPVNEGESGAIRVENLTNPMRGIAKPGPTKAAETNLCRAAHEKIAFDLAFLLQLPVPPVLLWRRCAPSRYRRGRCISAEAFAESFSWEEASSRRMISSVQKANAAPIFSAMRAFHVWISDHDRNCGQVRYDIRCGSDTPALAFVDHTYSMSWTWSNATPDIPLSSPSREKLSRNNLPDLMPGVTSEVADAIARLPNEKIEDVVNRIGEPYLPLEVKTLILCKLLDRKIKLSKVLKLD
jgi:hypothetical protein